MKMQENELLRIAEYGKELEVVCISTDKFVAHACYRILVVIRRN